MSDFVPQEYDLILYVKGEVTLAQLHEILDELIELGVSFNSMDFEFEDNGLFFDACARFEDTKQFEEMLNAIGVEIDWDTMLEVGLDVFEGEEEE